MLDLILSLLTDPGFALGWLGAAGMHLEEVAGALGPDTASVARASDWRAAPSAFSGATPRKEHTHD